jgi:hypothetical protein
VSVGRLQRGQGPGRGRYGRVCAGLSVRPTRQTTACPLATGSVDARGRFRGAVCAPFESGLIFFEAVVVDPRSVVRDAFTFEPKQVRERRRSLRQHRPRLICRQSHTLVIGIATPAHERPDRKRRGTWAFG